MGIGFGGTPSGLRIDMYDITDDGTTVYITTCIVSGCAAATDASSMYNEVDIE